MKKVWIARAIVATTLLVALAGCGQKGPLYWPKAPPLPQSFPPEVAPPPPVSPTTPPTPLPDIPGTVEKK